MRIRQSVQKAIIDTLDSSRFTAADFRLDFPDAEETYLKITFKPHPEFAFELMFSSYANTFSLRECPSVFHFVAIESGYDVEKLTKSISSWAARIHDELRAMMPIYDDFEELRLELEKKLEEHVNDANAHFTEEEAAQIREKIADFDKVLAQYAETHAELNKQIAALRRDIARANETIEAFSKSVWYKTSFNKVANGLKALGKSKEIRQLAVDSVKKLVFNSIGGGESGG
jgi:Hemerythrin HHE cation binding domain